MGLTVFDSRGQCEIVTDMRYVSSDNDATSPSICAALDAVITETALTNKAVGEAVGVSEQTVSRWRKFTEPSFSQIAAIEQVAHKWPGYVAEMAGYYKKPEPATAVDAVKNDPELNGFWRGMIITLIRQGYEMTRQARQARLEDAARSRRRRA